ncbi:hypothetical protein [Hoeflea sp.]|uniref:hypothetical protein n=1 Tax=Hoeflea sp. TaxID=1940281 RepID=UPI0019AB38C7|nr:hypothetical protein [Hoeflea sp.]MBC7282153.1 hypothetical protein [Hoeflea sp.]
MTTDTISAPMQAQTSSASARPVAPDPGEAFAFSDQTAAPMPLDLVELELALDLSGIREHGFCEAVREAATTVRGEYLFDLPASGLADDAQRIAVVCLSREEGGRFGLVLLSADGDQARTIEPDETTAGLVQFARAFVGVLEKL